MKHTLFLIHIDVIMASGWFFVAVAFILVVEDIGAATRARTAGNDDTFTYKITNAIRKPTFAVSTDISVVGHPLIRYMEETVLVKPLEFKSFTVNFTSHYGYFVSSINGVNDTYYKDGHYWEFFVNNKAASFGVSFYVPQVNDVAELVFTKETKCKQRDPKRNICTLY